MDIVNGNLFECIDYDSGINIIVHGCNAQNVMGSGFAKELKQRFPEAYQIYKNSVLNLGKNIFHYHSEHVIIANAITQQYYGYDGKKYVSYDAIHDAFTEINNLCIELQNIRQDDIIIHFPEIGSGLGGGSSSVIMEIINTCIDDKFKTILYRL